jgi:alpha-1,2-mannosyltransferase
VQIRIPRNGSPADLIFATALLSVWALSTIIFWWGHHAPDLGAIYFAGHFYANGQFEEIYAAHPSMFAGYVSEAWREAGAAAGFENESQYPFIYPPLWAALFAPVSNLLTMDQFFHAGYVVQILMLAISPWLAWRFFDRPVAFSVWVVFAIVLFSTTISSMIGLMNCQPHLTVGFLCILAFERARSGASGVAGLALALAASLKIFPALLAIFWLTTGDRRAFLWFTAIGATLGIASIAIAGWPLHEAFIARSVSLTETIHGIRYNISLQSAIYQLFDFAGTIRPDPSSFPDRNSVFLRQFIAAANPVASLIFAGLLVAGLLALAVRSQRAGRDAILWSFPAALLLISLMSPLSWVYYLLPIFALIPGLVRFYEPRRVLVLAIFTMVLTNRHVFQALNDLPGPYLVGHLSVVALSVVLFFAFAFAWVRAPEAIEASGTPYDTPPE